MVGLLHEGLNVCKQCLGDLLKDAWSPSFYVTCSIRMLGSSLDPVAKDVICGAGGGWVWLVVRH